jgi:glycosyltransferase involved in cell wall biosynthesis
MTRIAMFTTYAPSEGFGGPARAYHQRRVLESAGHDVTHVVIQATPDRGSLRGGDIAELVERPYRAAIDHIYNDVDLARRAAADPRLVDRLTVRLRSVGVGAIILEQPFLVEVVEQIAGDLAVPVLYSCQNIEYRLRKDLERFQPDPTRSADRSEQVRDLERRAVDLSTEITTICPTDRDQLLAEFGRPSTLVPNGSLIADLPLPVRSLEGRSGARFAFAGSAYWPNVEGFAEIATPSLAFLPPTCRIDVAGTVGTEILRNASILRHQSANASRMTVHGFVSMPRLVGLMVNADAVIVPVFVGEGSNLKSADALAAGAPVIMTTRAVRGYEDVVAADGDDVTVVDSTAAFREAMTEAVRQRDSAEPVGLRRRELLSWTNRLQPLVDVVHRLGTRSSTVHDVTPKGREHDS